MLHHDLNSIPPAVSAVAGVSTSPLLAQYGAAKAYVEMLSKSLREEVVLLCYGYYHCMNTLLDMVYCDLRLCICRAIHCNTQNVIRAQLTSVLLQQLKPFGIHVQCQVALLVATKLAKIQKASLFVPTPANYARAAVRAIGYEVRESVCV